MLRKLAMTAALVAAAAVPPVALGSSHREAPLTAIDPTADNTDVYAFTAKDDPGTLTIASNWIPFEDPAGGPNFYRFDDNARYYTNIDSTGDGKPDVRYLFTFRTNTRNPNSALIASGPGVKSPKDKNLNVTQSYTVTRDDLSGGQVTKTSV